MVTTDVLHSIQKIDIEQWNKLTETSNPFLQYEFLKALEVSKSVGNNSGWLPNYVVAWDDKKLVGAIPLYKKYNSMGEYIFDWQWAALYEHLGLEYFPKFTIAIPFTPATGSRLLVAADVCYEEVANLLVERLMEEAQRQKVHSIHWLFTTKQECEWLSKKNFIPRYTYQFHWKNQNYKDFDDFLQAFNSKKRNQIKRERRVAQEVNIEVLSGNQIQKKHWQYMYQFYLSTIGKKWAYPYLTKEFFEYIAKHFKQHVVMVLASKNDSYVAGALNFRKGKHMYGRYWGCLESYNNLHFEVCYYKSIEYCIDNHIQLYEAGAQGYHKVQRGYAPQYTYSCHFIQQPQLAEIIYATIAEENENVRNEINSISLPFRT